MKKLINLDKKVEVLMPRHLDMPKQASESWVVLLSQQLIIWIKQVDSKEHFCSAEKMNLLFWINSDKALQLMKHT